MNKQQWMTLAYWVMIIVVIVTCIVVIVYLKGNGKECLADPIKYYSKRMAQDCFCTDIFKYP